MIPNIPGIESEGVVDALKFLQTYNLRGSVPVKKRIIVVGGGNAAIDAARTAIRLGAEQVNVVYRRTQEEMPAWAEEIEAAVEEGIILNILTNPIEIIQKNGKVSGVKCVAMKLGTFDRSGRRSPVASNETFVIAAEQVILATGQTLDCSTLFDSILIDTVGTDKIKRNPLNGQTSIPWIFAGGDAATGPSSVIEAVAAGEIAAAGIDEFLTGENHAFWRENKKTDTFFDPDDEPALFPRKSMPLLVAERRKNNFDEVEQGWVEGEAVRQAKRCLRCDYGKC
jgi:NADH-quinone oxidoreductase subunit F